MGSAISTAAQKAAGFLVYIFTAPVKAMFSKSCEGKCGAWDLLCFIENGCGASVVRLFTASVVAIITVVALYFMLWETGLLKFLVKKSFKIPWKLFWGCFRALVHACARLCHKVRNTRRVYRAGRGPRDAEVDVEMGRFGWSSATDERSVVWGRRRRGGRELGWSGSMISVGSSGRKRGRSPVSVRERRKDNRLRPQQPLRLTTGKEIVKVEHPTKRSRVEPNLHHHHARASSGLSTTEASSSLRVRGRGHRAREH